MTRSLLPLLFLATACPSSSSPGVTLDLGSRPSMLVACTERDDMVACAHLAKDYADGRTGPGDRTAAEKLYQKACDGGVLGACVSLGVLVETQEPGRAMTLYRRACAGTDQASRADGCNNAGMMILEGKVEGKGLVDAIPLWRKACHSDSPGGCQNAAAALARYPEEAKSSDEPEVVRAKACALGIKDACPTP